MKATDTMCRVQKLIYLTEFKSWSISNMKLSDLYKALHAQWHWGRRQESTSFPLWMSKLQGNWVGTNCVKPVITTTVTGDTKNELCYMLYISTIDTELRSWTAKKEAETTIATCELQVTADTYGWTGMPYNAHGLFWRPVNTLVLIMGSKRKGSTVQIDNDAHFWSLKNKDATDMSARCHLRISEFHVKGVPLRSLDIRYREQCNLLAFRPSEEKFPVQYDVLVLNMINKQYDSEKRKITKSKNYFWKMTTWKELSLGH